MFSEERQVETGRLRKAQTVRTVPDCASGRLPSEEGSPRANKVNGCGGALRLRLLLGEKAEELQLNRARMGLRRQRQALPSLSALRR